MSICPKCNNPYFTSGNHCSRKCANSRFFSEETKALKREKQKKYLESLDEKSRTEYFDKRKRKFNSYSNPIYKQKRNTTIREKRKEKVELGEVKTKETIKLYFMDYKPYLCSICGQNNEWCGKKLVLQLDHIDGNPNNNTLENTRWLCPNCHTQTDTWGRKSRNNVSIA